MIWVGVRVQGLVGFRRVGEVAGGELYRVVLRSNRGRVYSVLAVKPRDVFELLLSGPKGGVFLITNSKIPERVEEVRVNFDSGTITFLEKGSDPFKDCPVPETASLSEV